MKQPARKPNPILVWGSLTASLIVLLLAIMMPLWLPRMVRTFIPDRYIVAYAPGFVQDIVFNANNPVALPTAAAGADQEQALIAELAGLAAETATALPTVASVTGGQTPITPTFTPPFVDQSASPTPTPASQVEDYVLLTGFEHAPQGWNKCGPATLATQLSYWGREDDQFQISAAIKPHEEDSNVNPWELSDYAESIGYDSVYRINGDIDTLTRLIAAGYPVIIERGFDELPDEGWMGHFMLMIGYDNNARELYALDSYWGTNRTHADTSFPVDTWAYDRFDSLWRHFNRAYVVIAPPGQYAQIAAIIGDEIDDTIMYSRALEQAYTEVNTYDDTFAWYNLGALLTEPGNYEQAATAFDAARERELPWRTYWYRFELYEAYYQVGRYEDVLTLALYTADPTNYPESEEAHYYMGLVYLARGQNSAARSAFEKALRYNPYFEPAQQQINTLGG